MGKGLVKFEEAFVNMCNNQAAKLAYMHPNHLLLLSFRNIKHSQRQEVEPMINKLNEKLLKADHVRLLRDAVDLPELPKEIDGVIRDFGYDELIPIDMVALVHVLQLKIELASC
ncbi:uncharacterized protein LOC132198113 [Neocloeon triangulifer]|uniref:uncharacterized protein LOC132198113 n=1 Tax=Neocloeon triangulifer TaxID=2078957 RepID=UPI00286EC3C5|nr:uncharacterized protein LOC132198113 [Neocloeon triangulifer]XP_059477891.1 uncharacterized protein LOC132198113 [Neocloeon triangulifer]